MSGTSQAAENSPAYKPPATFAQSAAEQHMGITTEVFSSGRLAVLGLALFATGAALTVSALRGKRKAGSWDTDLPEPAAGCRTPSGVRFAPSVYVSSNTGITARPLETLAAIFHDPNSPSRQASRRDLANERGDRRLAALRQGAQRMYNRIRSSIAASLEQSRQTERFLSTSAPDNTPAPRTSQPEPDSSIFAGQRLLFGIDD